MEFEKIFQSVIFLIPGFLAMEIYRAKYPAKKLSNFSFSSWSIIYGILISFIVCWIDSSFLGNILDSNKKYFPNFRMILSVLLTAILFGYIKVLIHFIRFKIGNRFSKLKFFNPDPQSIWAKVNQNTNRDWAAVFLDDNSIYIGYIKEYCFDPDAINNDFLLSNAKRVDEELKEIYVVDGIGVYLNTSNVKRIEFLKGY